MISQHWDTYHRETWWSHNYDANVCTRVDRVCSVFAGEITEGITGNRWRSSRSVAFSDFLDDQARGSVRYRLHGTGVDVRQRRGEGCCCSSRRGWIWGHGQAFWRCRRKALVWLSTADEADRSSAATLASLAVQIAQRRFRRRYMWHFATSWCGRLSASLLQYWCRRVDYLLRAEHSTNVLERVLNK